jgi:hypothetical protein
MVLARRHGHTLIEVWDDTTGWTLVDPSAEGFLTGATLRASAADLLADPAGLQWHPFAKRSIDAAAGDSAAKGQYFRDLLGGNLLYPEPWLYLRHGERNARWPFRGQYARVGPTYVVLGPAQQFLTLASPLLGLAGIVVLAVGWRKRHARCVAARSIRAAAAVETLEGRFDPLPPLR